MVMADTAAVIRRVVMEVAGTIATNGIQELSRDGAMCQFDYVRSCLIATAYNSLRAMPGFSESYGEFWDAVIAQVEKDLAWVSV